MVRTLTYSGEFTNDNAMERGMELVVAFMRAIDLPDDQAPRFVDARVCTIASQFLRWAYERNLRATIDTDYCGTGEYVQIHLTVLQDRALQIMVADCGGKECIIRKRSIDFMADFTTYELFNGGLLMRAIVKWKVS